MRTTYENQRIYDIFGDLLNTVGGAANTALGGILGLPLQAASNDMQANQQQRLTNIQIAGQKEMSDYNAALQKKFWDETNYEAQVEHLKAAGLNPALLYAKGGSGGSTMPGGGSVGMGVATPNQLQEIQQMQLATRQAEADIKLKEAQAANIDANTQKTTGVDTQQTQASIDQIKQLTQNAQVQNSILQWEAGIKSAEATVATQSIDTNIQTIQKHLEQLTATVRSTKTAADITEATKDQIIQQATNATMQQGLDMILTKAQTQGIITDIQATKRAILNAVQENMRKWDTQPNMSLEMQTKEFQNDLLQNSTLPNIGEEMLKSITHFVIPLSNTMKSKPNPIGFQQKW